MSRDWTHSDLTCDTCGNTGRMSHWSDDWNRWGSEWHGFSGDMYVTGDPRGPVTCKQCGGTDVSIVRNPVAST